MEEEEELFGEEEKRIIAIIQDEDLKVNNTTLQKYLDFLKVNLEQPCLLTGIEDFDWEEKYVFGYGDKKEYERLKKTNPSYTDTFELIEFEEPIEEYSNIFVKVRRITDKKVFSLQLFELEAVDKSSKNYQILDDYSVWITNYL